MSPKKRRGRPPKYVIDHEGKPVVGLSYDKYNNRYFNTHWKSEGVEKQNFGNDKYEAIALFRIWQSKNAGKRTEVEIDDPHIEKEAVVTKKLTPQEIVSRNLIRRDLGFLELDSDEEVFSGSGDLDVFRDAGYEVKEIYNFEEGVFWKKARELILNDINKARDLLQLPIVLDGEALSEKSMNLDEVADLYFNKRKNSITKEHFRNSLKYWNEFKKNVKIKKIGDLTEKHFVDFESWLKNQKKKKDWSNDTFNNRLNCISTIFNQALETRGLGDSEKKHLVRVVSICNFEYAAGSEFNPCPITKDDYLEILNHTKNKTYKAVMLLALNGGFKPTDLADIRIKPRRGQIKPDIDLKNKTLAKPRKKTTDNQNGIIRVALLWDRTVDAINEAISLRENKTEYLFVNQNGNQITPKNIQRWWQRVRKRSGVSEYVKFEHIRDAAQTVPIDIDSRLLLETKLLLGHSIPGVTNNYLRRRPSMVRNVCRILEEHYFGSSSIPASKNR